MIQNIPFKKLVLLVLLFGILAGTFVSTRWYIDPEINRLERDLKKSEGQIRTLKTDITEVEAELDLFEERKNDYELLNEAGFFKEQKRGLVQEALAESQRLSGIIGGSFEVSAPRCFLNKELEKSDYVIVGSPVVVNVDSFDDMKIYHFIDLFQQKLPGFAVLQFIDVQKRHDITHSLLQEIGFGEKVPLISARVTFEWYTIVEREETLCSSL